MSTYFNSVIRKRMILIGFVFIVWFVFILARLVHLQIFEHARYRSEVVDQNQKKIEIEPKRGTIYDRNGRIMARSLPVPSVFLQPPKNETPAELMAQVGRIRGLLQLSENDMARIEGRIRKKDPFIWIKRKIDPAIAEKIKDLGLGSVFLKEENDRFYPMGRRAAHVLGGVDIDMKGRTGVEQEYDSVLKGEKGQVLILRDARRRGYHVQTLKEAVAGKDIYLTIDEAIQYFAEKELEKAVAAHNADWGTVIVSNPGTGEILAMANHPTYDPNDFPPPVEAIRNKAIQDTFEPGSTFKVVTAAAARETQSVGLTDVFDCSDGAIEVGGGSVRDHVRMGMLSFEDVLVRSSNVGTIKIASRVGEKPLFGTILKFRFGQPTGIDLPGEASGKVRPLDRWNKLMSLSHVAIGYEVSVTAAQLLQAINIIANGGKHIPLRVTRDLPAGDHDRPEGPVRAIENTISERTARELTAVFEKAVREGTGTSAKLDGFEVAGKTGTAQIYDQALRSYVSSRHMAAFVGFVPTENPVLSMTVIINEPKGVQQYGGQVAAPVFREVAAPSLRYLHVQPRIWVEPIITAKLEKGKPQ